MMACWSLSPKPACGTYRRYKAMGRSRFSAAARIWTEASRCCEYLHGQDRGFCRNLCSRTRHWWHRRLRLPAAPM